jgi:hypothetical protein
MANDYVLSQYLAGVFGMLIEAELLPFGLAVEDEKLFKG